MKFMFKGIFYSLFLAIVFESCYEKPCLPPHLIIKNNSAFEGETLNLTAQSLDGATYTWSGPYGFLSTDQNPSIPNVAIANSGKYLCVVKVGKCENAVTKEIEIMAKPTCSPTNNTMKLGIQPTMSFSTTKVGINSDNLWEITGENLNGNFKIEFHTDPFEKGSFKYLLSRDQNSYNAKLQITNFRTPYEATDGFLYVSVSNNRITATFCNAEFTSSIKGSGRISTK